MTWDDIGVRRAIAERDVATVYRYLVKRGVSQHTFARLTGQTQSEACEILKGRVVKQYDTLLRIAEGLSIPREWMGLSYGGGAYTGDEPGSEEEDDVLRAHRARQVRRGTLDTAT